MGWISVRVSPNNEMYVAQSTYPFNAKKFHPVLNKKLVVDILDRRRRLTAFRQLNDSSEAASARVKSCTKKALSVDFFHGKTKSR